MYRIDGIEWDKSPMDEFEMDSKKGPSRRISFSEYYKQSHNATIRDSKQPLIVFKPGKNRPTLYLIPELCRFTGL